MFIPLLAESFWSLLRDPAHWYFELFLMLLFDVLIGAIAWPIIRRHIHRDVDAAEEHEHDQIDLLYEEIADLRQHIGVLEGDEEAILTEVREGRKSINWARVKLGMVPLITYPLPWEDGSSDDMRLRRSY